MGSMLVLHYGAMGAMRKQKTRPGAHVVEERRYRVGKNFQPSIKYFPGSIKNKFAAFFFQPHLPSQNNKIYSIIIVLLTEISTPQSSYFSRCDGHTPAINQLPLSTKKFSASLLEKKNSKNLVTTPEHNRTGLLSPTNNIPAAACRFGRRLTTSRMPVRRRRFVARRL